MLAYFSFANICVVYRVQTEGSGAILGWICLNIILFGALFWLGVWAARRQLLPKIERAKQDLDQVKHSKAANERLIVKLERKVQELEWDVYDLRLAKEELENARRARQVDEEEISRLEKQILELQQTINRGRAWAWINMP